MNPNVQGGLVLTVIELFGDYGAKMQNPLLCYLGYNALAYTLLQLMKTQSLTLVNANWDGISNLFTMLLGFMLGERFQPRQYLGLGLVTAGLLLI